MNSSNSGNLCSCNYNGMLYPIRQMSLHAMLWYQGESNMDTFQGSIPGPANYACRIRAAVSDFRDLFNHPSLPFFNVELSACNNYPTVSINSHSWAYMRQASRSFLSMPFTTGFITAIDVGTKGGGVHSPEKQPVGHRMALQLLKKVYGQEVLADGPAPQSIAVSKDRALLQINFSGADRLHLAATAAHTTTGSKLGCAESPFELGFADGEWIRVNFTIALANIVISLPVRSEQATEIRYAWEGFPQCVLYSGSSGDFSSLSALPAAPFRLAIESACAAKQVKCLLGGASSSTGHAEYAQCCSGKETCVPGGGCQNPFWIPSGNTALEHMNEDIYV